ncbi:MAG: ATP-binding cassette domain-containing protein [Eggerthellaceae bacterium]|nr:ATP-binding cassette domain-containing protein [Eggerthellaceae bacterium]
MLQLRNIRKSYTTGTFTQKALDDVSISFRDNEFVAILGPSGSGKTTLLNIVGGLDHYDSGDLVIDGVSTKKYRDRDWDAYRNNRIGFVFQSYNLIPHQTVLANVELALTLSGVSRNERRKRAQEALERVGLAEHMDKKPSQMSGGQMQRVAIARALINDPEILLADEPTGALDSKTSVQIMDLLTEIAEDRLVVMVTHNPELAEKYATRIVNLADGRIMSDTDPYTPTAGEIAAVQAKPVRHTKMSFLTALSLSANNLLTKKGRTLMTAIAGSIGIIGIAAILSLANGVNNYIKNVEEETLSVYPLQILSTGFDLTTMFVGMGGDDDAGDDSQDSTLRDEVIGELEEGHIGEARIISRMFASFGNNDLAALKAYFDSGESGIDEYVSNIYYEYAVTPQIFDADTSDGVRQINPDNSLSAFGMGSSAYSNSLMSMSMSSDMFNEMMDNDVVAEQYDLKAGHWPEKANELVLVLSPTGRINDFLSYVLGLRDPEELKDMVKQFSEEQDVEMPDTTIDVTYDDILNMKFKLVNAVDFYKYDEERKVWVDKTDDKKYMKKVVESGEDLVISGIVQSKPDAKALALTMGIYYTPALTRHLAETAAKSKIVKDQLAKPKVDVFSGKTFDELEDEEGGDFDMTSLFSIDEDAMASAFNFDMSSLDLSGMDFSGLDLSGLDFSKMDLSQIDLSKLDLSDIDMSNLDVDPPDFSQLNMTAPTLTNEDLAELFPELSGENIAKALENVNVKIKDEGQLMATVVSIGQDYMQWRASSGQDGPTPNPDARINAYLQTGRWKQFMPALIASIDTDDLGQQLSGELATLLGTTPDQLNQEVTKRVAAKYAQSMTESMQTQMGEIMQEYIGQVMEQYMTKVLQPALSKAMQSMMTQFAETISKTLQTQLGKMMSQLSSKLTSAFSNMGFDEEAFMNAFQFDMDEEELTELMMSMMRTEERSYDNNLKKLGYASFDKPSEISIYPIDFASKEHVIEILDAYNDNMREVDEDKVISYTDIVGTLMDSVTTIVDMISYVLIAFVAISLIVSSIMIGVITYISVLERRKEIGILRSIGASKGDISRVFNAETIIEGLISGLLGVGFTALACIPANAIVYANFDVPNVAILPPQAAAILVGVSVLLTFIAGLIPSRSASRKDPVEALRSE